VNAFLTAAFPPLPEP
jgi:hypothetical protein